MFLAQTINVSYVPRPALLFGPSKIVLTKGSDITEPRRRFAQMICAAYPDTKVIEAFDLPQLSVTCKTTHNHRVRQTFYVASPIAP